MLWNKVMQKEVNKYLHLCRPVAADHNPSGFYNPLLIYILMHFAFKFGININRFSINTVNGGIVKFSTGLVQY
jgi:hypothetical protein